MEINKKVRKNKILKGATILCCIVIVIILTVYAYARYITKLNGEVHGQMANYSLVIEVDGNTNQNFVVDLADTRGNDTDSVESGYVAPGTSGAFDIEIDASDSDVSLVYNINVDTNNIPKNLHFYVDANRKNEIFYSDNTFGYEGFIGYNDQNKSKTQTVYWDWPYETGETEEEILANDLDDSEWIGHHISLSLNITGTQVKSEPEYLANVAVPGTYVDYVDGDGNTINCVVLYNDSTNGLQIVSIEPVRSVTLGTGDPKIQESDSLKKVEKSYNRAIISLNEYAMDYLNTDLAYNARCVGSRPTDKNYPNNLTGSAKENMMFVADYDYLKCFEGIMYGNDGNWYTDSTRLQQIGFLGYDEEAYGTRYWLASRSPAGNSEVFYFRIFMRASDGSDSSYSPLFVRPPSNYSLLNPTYAFRPVFYLKPHIKISGGEGTVSSPYQIIEN